MSNRLLVSIRVVLALLAGVSILFLSPWIALLCAAVSALRFPAYEMVCIALVADLLYLPGLYSLPYATIMTLVLVASLMPLRNEIMTRAG